MLGNLNTTAVPKVDVLLVSLPFGLLYSPSIALGILQTQLRASGLSVRSKYLSIDYAAQIGVPLYNKISSGLPETTDLIGEWIFSSALFPEPPHETLTYLKRTFERYGVTVSNDGGHLAASGGDPKRLDFVHSVIRSRETAVEFVNYACNNILAYKPSVVGLTSVFQQNVPTLAVARRLKKLAPTIKIVVGGANVEGEMGREIARQFDFLDVVVSGEADRIAYPLIRCLLQDKDIFEDEEAISHSQYMERSLSAFVQAAAVTDLATSSDPDYEDYFIDLRDKFGPAALKNVRIPLETSRGCWWGMKHHCTFCGLNGSNMTFRSKPSAQAVAEIESMASRYPGLEISFVDNILDYKYFNQVLPALKNSALNLKLFYEIKSNTTKQQLRLLRESGVTRIQPGIESLSDDVLRLMKKGVKAIQNIQLLKWCQEFGIACEWNLIWGFPGEAPEAYRKISRVIELISHCQPPCGADKIRLDRFSPNFMTPGRYGFTNVRPYPAYESVYKLSPDAIQKIVSRDAD
jgi:ribosomal peptide maturation radical SAM protein 1